ANTKTFTVTYTPTLTLTSTPTYSITPTYTSTNTPGAPTSTFTPTSTYTTTITPTNTPIGTITPVVSPVCQKGLVHIFDERGELIRTMCGVLVTPKPQNFVLTVSTFTPDPSGVGGTMTLFINGQMFATWDVLDKEGKIVPSGFYHLVVDQTLTDGTAVTLAKDVFVSSLSQVSAVQLMARPNLAHAGDTITLLASFVGGPADGRSQIKIYAVSGELVRTLALLNGQVQWDLTNDSQQKVASGIYVVVLDGVDLTTSRNVQKTIQVAILK
ncbi:MAG TPA: hypothetical protein VIJ93_01150, partial [bacterium]